MIRTPTGDVALLDSQIIRHLTLAVFVKDDFTGQRPIGRIRVYVNELKYTPIINKSGYHLFIDVGDRLNDEYSLLVESNENYYVNRSILIRDIKQGQDIQANPAFEVSLNPSTSYPFGEGFSLVRGTVLTVEGDMSTKKPIGGARIELKERAMTTLSEQNGDFIFYFKGLKKNDIIEKDEKKFIRMGSSTETDLVVTFPGFNDFRKTGCEVEVGKTAIFVVTLSKEV